MTYINKQTPAAVGESDGHINICVPIVYGSIAHHLGKQATDHQTHQWSIYVRPHSADASAVMPNLETIIEKVVFHLHPSFSRPVREVTNPPYQVTEAGWGEFEAGIKIYWKNDKAQNSKSVTSIIHALKLYEQIPQQVPIDPNLGPDQQPQQVQINSDKAVVHECYDEVVFNFQRAGDDPFLETLLGLSANKSSQIPEHSASSNDKMSQGDKSEGENVVSNSGVSKANQMNKPSWPDTYWTDEMHVNCLAQAQNFIDSELTAVKDRILKADAELAELERRQTELAAAKAAAKANSVSSR